MRTPRNDSDALTASADLRPPRVRGGHEPERRCVISGDRAPAHQLLRLALAPDGQVLPDILGKAPGRGAWIAADRPGLEHALAKGKLKAGLARAFKTGAFQIPDDLPDRIEAMLERFTLERLGLEARGGFLLTGTERIETAARGGAVALLLHARDAAPDGRRKLAQAWRVGSDREGSGVEGTILPVDRGALSVALGRENAVHLALTDERAAARVLGLLGRWQYFIGWARDAARDPMATDAVAGAVPSADDE